MTKFNQNWRQMGDGQSATVMAVMIELMLMQRLEKSTTKLMEPIQVMDVLALLGFMSVKDIHAILSFGNHVLEVLLLNHERVSLR